MVIVLVNSPVEFLELIIANYRKGIGALSTMQTMRLSGRPWVSQPGKGFLGRKATYGEFTIFDPKLCTLRPSVVQMLLLASEGYVFDSARSF